MGVSFRMNRRTGIKYWLGIGHVAITVISSLLCILFFPFLSSVFTQLDVTGCISGCSLALMAFPETKSVGFINLENCVFFFSCGIALITLLIVSLVLAIRRKKMAYYWIVGVYTFDCLFLLIHYFFLRNMLDISAQDPYAILSILYKLIGMTIFISLIAKKNYLMFSCKKHKFDK